MKLRQLMSLFLTIAFLLIVSMPTNTYTQSKLLSCSDVFSYSAPQQNSITAAKRIKNQNEALDKIIQWMRENKGKQPDQYDYGNAPGKINLSDQKLMGTGHYKEGSTSRDFRIFDSPIDFWIALQTKARENGITIYLIDVPFRKHSSELRLIFKKESLTRVIQWMRENDGRQPTQDDFGDVPGKIHLNYSQLMGVGKYKEGDTKGNFRYYDSALDFWMNLRQRTQAEGLSTHLVDVRFQESSNEKRNIVKTESLDLVVDWMKNNKRKIPANTDFGDAPGKIPLTYKILMGMDKYSEGAQFGQYRIFDSPLDFWMALQKKAKQNGIIFNLVDVKFREMSDEVRLILRSESLDLIMDWIQKNEGQVPSRKNFGTKPNQIHLSYPKLMGITKYGEGGTARDFRIFDSSLDFWEALLQRINEKGFTSGSPTETMTDNE